MDYQHYIRSGVLELYVMEALSPAEMKDVERAAAADPRVAGEIETIRETLRMLAEEGRQAPPPQLREITLAAIADAPPEDDRATDAGASVVSPGRLRRYAAAAAWVLAIASSMAAVYIAALWRGALDEVEWLRGQNGMLARALTDASRSAASTREAIALFEDAHNHAIALRGTAHAPDAHPVIYWNARTGDIHVAPASMPPPPEGHRFELWAVRHGHRVHAGSFTAGANTPRLQRVGRLDAVDSFAVTLGPSSGSMPVLAVGGVAGGRGED